MEPTLRTLGKTGIRVTPIGLGVWQFSQGKGAATSIWSALEEETSNRIVKVALEGGINWFDTAEIYGGGRSERALAQALKAAGVQKNDVVIATKWNPMFRSARSIKRTIIDRHYFLEGFGIDLHQVHNPSSFSSVEAEMEAMADLVAAGEIRSVGVSNFSEKRMRRAHARLARRGIPLASNQVKYSLLDRRIERNGVLEAAKELGITIIAYSPLEMGLLSGKFHKDPAVLKERPFARKLWLGRLIERSRPLVEVLETIAEVYQVTPSQVALSWLVNFHGECVVAIPGASKPKHAEESAASMRLRLSKEDMARLDEASRAF